MPSRWFNRRQKFRAIFAGSECVHPASVHDPIAARIAFDLGFEAGMLAGSTASLAVLAAPDLITLTLTEFASQALRIGRAADLPLMCDADHGYGNALSVMRTVEELETAGVAGLSIEDTELPQPFGAGDKQRLLSVEEGVGKMKAALAGRGDPELIIAGRTSAPGISGIADTVKRAKAYEAAGVDAMFLVGCKARSEVEAVAAEIKIPIILGNVSGDMADKAWLARTNVRFALVGHQPIAAAARAVYDVMKALRDGTKPADLEGVGSPEFMRRVSRADDYAKKSRDWLGG